MRSQEKFQEIATKLEWENLQREAATAVRELEFTLTQLEINIDELMDAMQYVMFGRVPVNLISPWDHLSLACWPKYTCNIWKKHTSNTA